MVDLAGHFIPEPFRIPILIHRSIDSLPDIPLPSASAFIADGEFVIVLIFHRKSDISIRCTTTRTLDLHPIIFLVIGIWILINVDDLVVTKIYRIRAESPGATKKIRMEDLEGQRLPPACRTSGEDTCVRLSDYPKMLFHKRDELLHDGIAVGTAIFGIDCIGIIIVGAWMLKSHQDHPGTFPRDPKLIKFISAT